MNQRFVLALAAATAIAGGISTATAAVSYAVGGSTYTQDFDSLPNSPTNTSLGNSPAGWIDDTTTPGANQFSILGWYLYHPTSVTEGGANGNQRFRNGSGNSGTGAYYSFGANSTTERALGDVGANTLAANNAYMYYALRLTNDTGQPLESFTLSFIGEQWRNSGVENVDEILFAYSTNATASNFFDDTAATFTAVPALNFISPITTGTAAALDGNAAENRTALSATVSGINWQPGTDLWLRWASLQHATTDHGMAIDDLTFSAQIPEPASLGLLALAAAPMLRRRRPR